MVYGDHGPYIELSPENLIEEAWLPIIEKSGYAYYDERYPKDGSECKLYIQKKSVRCLPNPPKGKDLSQTIDWVRDMQIIKLENYISLQKIS